MRLILVLACALSCFAATSSQAAPASKESIERLFVVTNVQKSYGAMLDSMKTSMDQMFQKSPQAQSLTPEQRKRFDAGMAQAYELMRGEMDWNTLKPEFEQAYRDTFTQEEVDGLLTFYRSPAGKAMIEKMPMLVGKMMQMSQARMQNLMPRVMQIMQDAMRDAK